MDRNRSDISISEISKVMKDYQAQKEQTLTLNRYVLTDRKVMEDYNEKTSSEKEVKNFYTIILREIDFDEKAQTVKLNYILKDQFACLIEGVEDSIKRYNSQYYESDDFFGADFSSRREVKYYMEEIIETIRSVSYTHLTLPTIYSV